MDHSNQNIQVDQINEAQMKGMIQCIQVRWCIDVCTLLVYHVRGRMVVACVMLLKEPSQSG